MTDSQQPTPPRVLLVEAESDCLRLTDEAARRLGWAVERVECGEEALASLRRRPSDVLVLEYPLPDMTVGELLDRARATPPGPPPFLVVARAGSERVAVEMMKRGARDYLVKDDLFAEVFPATLERLLGEQERERQLEASLAQLRARDEEERRRLEARLRQTQTMESLGALAGGIAHDFNNLLAAILGNAELAALELPPNSPIRENLDNIAQSAQRASRLVGQMLVYSGQGRFQVQMVDLTEAVRELAHQLPTPLPPHIALDLNPSAALPPVQADPQQLRQSLHSLLANAVEAVGERPGRIRVTTGTRHCDRAYLEGTLSDDGLPEGVYAYVEVADTGCGMAPETQAKLFQPFFTTKFAGRGLGLAAVLGIVRAHSGAIKVVSAPGKGSVFTLLLPAAVGAAPELGTPPAPAAEWRGSGTILVVDDEESMRAVARKYLARLGFMVSVAVDGSHALEVFRKAPGQFAAVLLDYAMPHLDGRATFHELRRIRPDIKVILASGCTQPQVSALLSGEPLAGFIQKPYHLETLREALRQALEEPSGSLPGSR